MFFNACIRQAQGNPVITPQMLKEAEGEYSRQRLRSLLDEWSADFPYLALLLDALKGRSSQFPLDSISDIDCIELAIKLLEKQIDDEELAHAVEQVERNTQSTDALRRCVASVSLSALPPEQRTDPPLQLNVPSLEQRPRSNIPAPGTTSKVRGRNCVRKLRTNT